MLRTIGSAAATFGSVPTSGSLLSLLKVEQAVAASGGVQGHWGLVPFNRVELCGASLVSDGSGLALPLIATPSSLLVLHGDPGSVISLVPLLLHSPHDTATPLKL